MLTQPLNVRPVICWALPQHMASTTLQLQCNIFVYQRSKQTFLARKNQGVAVLDTPWVLREYVCVSG